MAKCVRCGKKGLFLKLNSDGYCENCADEVEREYREIRERAERKEKERIENARIRYESIPDYKIELSEEPRNRRRGYEPVKTVNITPKGVYDRFVVFDTETTGLTPSKDRIVEIGAVRFVDGVPVQKFSTLVNPEKPIPPEASKVSGIADEDVVGAPTIAQVLPAFEQFVGDDILVAHNLEFDLKFIFYSGSDLFDTKRKYIDTVEQAKKMLKQPKRKYDPEYESWEYDYESYYDVDDYKLETLCNHFGIYRTVSHRAAADALATGDVFLKLVEEKQG